MSQESEQFGAGLRALRAERGWTILDVVVRLRGLGSKDYGEANVRHWESGRHWPSAETIPLLADLFGVTTDHLFGRTNASGSFPG